MNLELKPCPFCGSGALLGGILLPRHHIFCAKCQARGPEGKTLEAASAAWNRRAEGPAEEPPKAAPQGTLVDRYSRRLRAAVTVFDVDGVMDAAEADLADGKLTTEELDRLARIAEDVTAELEGRNWV